MNKLFLSAIIFVFIFSSCKKDSGDVNPDLKGPLAIEFDHIVGGQNLIMDGTTLYTNAAGEDFSVSLVQYYISNIVLQKADGSKYVVPQEDSYFLIKENNTESRHARVTVPEGDYTALSFMLGVDSLRSTMDIGARTGALDPAGDMETGMYWGWNSGYIFFKMEGFSDKAPEDPSGQHKFRYHIGGFGGMTAPTINNIKVINIDLKAGGTAKVREGRGSNIHLMVDLAKVFTGTTDISIQANPTVMFSAFSVNVANNLTGMFRHDHTEN